jgi:hypothetical protein
MRVLGLGIDYATGKPALPPQDEGKFARKVQATFQAGLDHLREEAAATTDAGLTRDKRAKRPAMNLNDPRSVGWTFLVNKADGRRQDFLRILEPLARHRGMTDPRKPLTLQTMPSEEWFDWLQKNYSPPNGPPPPHFVLIVGGPEQVPFRFQSLLNCAAAVGRVEFDSLEELEAYVKKVLALERRKKPATARQAVVFAPDGGPDDATYFSHRYMAIPLLKTIQAQRQFTATPLLGDDATKDALLKALRGGKPALVYTASHGLAAMQADPEEQRRLQGAICCQGSGSGPAMEWLLTADDIPLEEPFLEGGVFFQFACFGYGTPARSDFAHWLGKPEVSAPSDFVAALPKRLLAHPRGPVAFIGHVDTAWLHGFRDPSASEIRERLDPRLAPFVHAVTQLLQAQPVGIALADMSKRYNWKNAELTDLFDRAEAGEITWDAPRLSRLVDDFIVRTDAQNYMIFGDPAAAAQMSDV